MYRSTNRSQAADSCGDYRRRRSRVDEVSSIRTGSAGLSGVSGSRGKDRRPLSSSTPDQVRRGVSLFLLFKWLSRTMGIWRVPKEGPRRYAVTRAGRGRHAYPLPAGTRLHEVRASVGE